VLHALSSLNQGGEVHDAIKPLSEQAPERSEIGKIVLDKVSACRNHGTEAVTKVIEDDNLVPTVHQ
jgi:hypothetical protein